MQNPCPVPSLHDEGTAAYVSPIRFPRLGSPGTRSTNSSGAWESRAVFFSQQKREPRRRRRHAGLMDYVQYVGIRPWLAPEGPSP